MNAPMRTSVDWEKLHIFVTCDGIDSLESHQTQRFYCWRWAQVWCSSQQQEHWQVSNFPLLWCPNNEELGLVVVQFKIIVQHPWTDVPYLVFDTFHRKKCVHINLSQLPKWNMVNFNGGRVAFSLKSSVRLSENKHTLTPDKVIRVPRNYQVQYVAQFMCWFRNTLS